jgi:sulfoxide reductase catalytic subunit YedY
MLIKSKKSSDIPSSEVTPKWLYSNRRKFMAGAALAAAGAVGYKAIELFSPSDSVHAGTKLQYT